MMRTLVITAGTAEPGEGNAHQEARPAIDQLTGKHDRLVVASVRAVWARWGRETMDLAVLYGTRGLVGGGEVLEPGVATWDPSGAAGPAGAALPPIPEQATALAQAYELVLFLLSGDALAAIGLPLAVPERVQRVVLTDGESLAWVPVARNLWSVLADGPTAARRWHVKAGHVRGFLFRRLCRQVVQHGPGVLEWLHHQPGDLEQLFYKRARWRPQFPLW
jgi:hypothetical protein